MYNGFFLVAEWTGLLRWWLMHVGKREPGVEIVLNIDTRFLQLHHIGKWSIMQTHIYPPLPSVPTHGITHVPSYLFTHYLFTFYFYLTGTSSYPKCPNNLSASLYSEGAYLFPFFFYIFSKLTQVCGLTVQEYLCFMFLDNLYSITYISGICWTFCLFLLDDWDLLN